MKIIVFGANGRTGQEVIKQALNKGIEVTAFVRNAENMKIQSEKLQIIVGQATNYEDVKKAMAGHDAVISCIGGPGMKASTTITDITKNIVDAMNEAGVKRILQMASAGVHGELKGIAGKAVMLMLKNPLKDHAGAYNKILESGVDYTLARPLGLTDGDFTGVYREAEEGAPEGGKNISRADVASFLLKAVQDDKYIGKSVGLSY
ncbi:NAD(P)-binding oxidoreductase [Clostridium sp. AL.422]|uniref:NAD(P)-dependent oxidoreductase n=1 Tax=Clostridium TaxID=1485 RepID=UPI00293DD241|nr:MULTISPECIES: NAD(P)-binding oxidoreductase [unclassified Clostridium]MDV4149942.1 NAD(P)-binding oxidoreductase [Clostridium sp. AL.422]